MLVANHYVKVDGVIYLRGEVIPDDIAPVKRDWLVSVGAIREMEDSPSDNAEAETEPSGESEEEPEIGMNPPEEPDENTAAPEIDAMAGVVRTPKRRRGGKKNEG